jgi:hypothetical protein
MKPTMIIFASAMFAIGVAVPAGAQQQDSMNHSSMEGMKMSPSDMDKMMACKRMSKSAMMNDKRCSDMMKMHPDMMNMTDAEMKKMSACRKMSKSARMADQNCKSMMEMHHNRSGIASGTGKMGTSQGSANASDRAMTRANENSALSSTGMMGNYPPCTRQRTDSCTQLNERGMRGNAAPRTRR